MNADALQPLGDQAVQCSFADEDEALRFAGIVQRLPDSWLVDVVSAYSTVAAFFDPDQTRFTQAADRLRSLDLMSGQTKDPVSGKLHRIPCCYEMQLDMARVEQHIGLGLDEIVRLHTSVTYRIYAIGFCPGFPYLGYLPEELQGVPRLSSPRVRVEQGSVGLTGKQTGIYTEARPGGWNVIGRTPLTLVDVRREYFPLRTGDRVIFERIDLAEYGRLVGSLL